MTTAEMFTYEGHPVWRTPHENMEGQRGLDGGEWFHAPGIHLVFAMFDDGRRAEFWYGDADYDCVARLYERDGSNKGRLIFEREYGGYGSHSYPYGAKPFEDVSAALLDVRGA